MNLIVGLVKERLNSGVDFGLYESQYYNDSATPDIMIPVFRDGNASIGPWANVNTMTLFNYANNGIDTIVNNNNIALHNETGAIYGVAFQPKKNRTFSSAFAKRHVGFGPQGSGGVYIFEDNGSGQDLTGSFSLQGVTPSNGGIVLDFGTIDRVDSPGGNANYLGSGNASRDEDAYGKVGNVSYGDIDVYNSDKLYMINLFQRRLIVMDVSANTSTLNNASVGTLSPIVDAYEIVGANGVPSCTNGEIRPFGLTFHQGKGYMGIVCDGELDNKFTNDNVVAYVLSFDPSNIGAGFTEELSIPMSDYRTGPQNWRRWSNTYSDTQTGTAGSAIVAPQPILSDIDFDINGDMIVGFMDRFGHQIGSQNYEPGTNNLINGIGYGEILRVCKNGGTWEIEGTGTCPVNFTDSNNIVDSYSGLGEYYNDAQGDKTNPYNGEASNGAFASLMGSGQILSTVMDPYPSGTNGDFTTYGSTGGVHWFNHTNGSWDNYLRIYNNTSIGFRKSHGLGDIEILTSTPPLEIGNRVWEDTDGDGIQDPDELGLDGVTVHLYDGATLVGTTTTANGGQWYFNDGNVLNNELLPNTTYTIRIVSTDFPSGETLTLTDSDGSTNGDLRDNDASLVSGNAEITYTTGTYGNNDHTLDIGFKVAAVCAITVESAVPTACNPADNTYNLGVTVTYSNAPTGDLTINVNGTDYTFTPDGSGNETFSLLGLISNGTQAIDVTATFVGDNTCTYTLTAAYDAPASCFCTPSCLLNASFFQDVILGFDGTTYTAEGQGTNGSCVLDGTYDMAIGPNGNLFISSSLTNEVLQFDINSISCIGAFVTAGSGGLDNPRGITFLPNGNLLVNSHNSGQILEYDGTTGAFIGIFSDGTDITPIASMAPHMSIKVGPDGAVWVADHTNNRILRFDATTGAFLSVFAQLPNGSGVRSFEFVGNNVLISRHNVDEVVSYDYLTGVQNGVFADASESLDGPTGITYGPDGNVYIGSLNTNQILVFDVNGTLLNTIAADSPKDILFKCGECFAVSCTLSVESAVPTACNPVDNTYNLDVTVTYSGTPAGDITINVNGTDYTFTPDGSGSETFTITGLNSDGATSIDVTATFVGDSTCTHTLTPAYDAPTNCLCTLTDAGVITTCNDEGTGDPSDDTFTVTLNPTGSGIGGTYSVSGDITAANIAYGSAQAVGGTYLISGGDLTITITDDATGTCTLIDVVVPAPAACSTCNLLDGGISAVYDNKGTSDTSDDTWAIFTNPSGSGTAATYTVSGDVSASNVAYGSVQQVGEVPASQTMITVTITDEGDSNCQLSDMIFNFDPNGVCDLVLNPTTVCDDAGTPTDPSDDTFTISLNPTGTGLGTTYSISGDITQANVAYGSAQQIGTSYLITDGAKSITLTDDANTLCRIDEVISTPAACSTPCPEQCFDITIIKN